NMEVFAESNDLVRQIAQQLRRRIVVRPDPSLLAPQDEAEKVIREVILPEAQITGIYFEPETGEVTIEALSPGVVIGRHGSVLNEIKKKIGWAPKVVRTPPIPSKTVEEIRQYLRTINDERQSFLKQVGRRLAREVPQGSSPPCSSTDTKGRSTRRLRPGTSCPSSSSTSSRSRWARPASPRTTRATSGRPWRTRSR